MSRIAKLTPDQRADLAATRDEWLRVGLSTAPVDRDEAREAVAAAYRAAGLAPPPIVIHLDGPFHGAVAAAMFRAQVLDQVGTRVRDQVWAQVLDQVWTQVGNQVGNQVGDQVRGRVRAQAVAQVLDQVGTRVRDQVWAQVGNQVGDQVWNQVGDQVRAQVWTQVGTRVGTRVGDQVWAQVGDQVGGQVRAQVWTQVWTQVRNQVGGQVRGRVRAQVATAIHGSQDAGWLAVCDFYRRHFGLAGQAEGLMRLARAAGWVWPFEGLAIVTARPTLIRRDELHRLHAADGPALLYGDGLAVYAWHGTRVPGEWVEQRRTIDPAVILRAPVEQRAAGMALIGWPRAMAALDCRVIDHDPDPSRGDLIELTLPGLPNPGRFLRALCPRNGLIVEGVPQADERGRPIETVRAAQAWRLGLAPEQFAYPQRRT